MVYSTIAEEAKLALKLKLSDSPSLVASCAQKAEALVFDAEHEDIKSIGHGIAGYKGRIDIRFSPALTGEYETAVDVADALDQAIVSTYQLQSTNLIAYELIYGKPALDAALATLDVPVDQLPDTSTINRQVFLDRMASISDEDSLSALNMYANPIVTRLRLLTAAK